MVAPLFCIQFVAHFLHEMYFSGNFVFMSIDEIKRLTLQALMSDDILMQGLVLKGGNALQLAYDITNRGSIDIDFSMEHEFPEKDFTRLTRVFGELLNDEFSKVGIVAYDVKFIKKPKTGAIPEWRGYLLEFKLIEKELFDKFVDDIDAIRRNSIKVNGQSTRYTVDISSYEYVEDAVNREIDGLILKVYTPEMILVEKIRALCQSMKQYKEIVYSAKQKERARDLYDIWMIKNHFKELKLTPELFQHIFAAKCVPLNFLNYFEELREQNRENWDVVRQTIHSDEELKDYDYYFDYVKELIAPFTPLLDNTDSNAAKIP